VPLTLDAADLPGARVVRIYDAAGLDALDRARAIEDARMTLAAEHIDAVWHDCDGRAGELDGWCANRPLPGELIVRLVRSPRRPVVPNVLGHALVNPVSNHGTLATVFIDRIERIAGAVEVDARLITGRVIAHEVSHLVRGRVHTDAGLMKPVWTLEDLATCARAAES
jgi:hypothetical protein